MNIDLIQIDVVSPLGNIVEVNHPISPSVVYIS